MPSALATSKLFSTTEIKMFDHDPGATSAIICSPDGGTTKRVYDLAKGGGFAVAASPQALVGAGITLLEIVAAEDAAMTVNLTQIKTSGAVVADNMEDFVVLECIDQEVVQQGANLRYVAARITMANAGDEARVVYIGYGARHQFNGLTATTIN